MKPTWLKKKLGAHGVVAMQDQLRASHLHTVCEEARCPNLTECFSKGRATVMIMGDICTRSCKFCAVATGRPKLLDPLEPGRVAKWAGERGFKHIVITSVDRDDLPDLGAGHFAETIRQVKRHNPAMIVEVLTPDFQGREELIDQVAREEPHIYNHNLETVERLTPVVRSAAKYQRSLSVISAVKKKYPQILTKSGLMLGLGELEEEVRKAMSDLLQNGCELLTLGQYLQPTPKHLPVEEYVHPDKFAEYKRLGDEMGFKAVSSGPFVRSSYMAEELIPQRTLKRGGSVFDGKGH